MPKRKYINQATIEADLRFGPDSSALKAALRAAEQKRDASIASARSGADTTIGEIGRTLPQVRTSYDRAGKAQAMTAGLVNQGLGGLSHLTDPIKAAALIEQGSVSDILQGQRASALGGLKRQRVQAQQGAQFAGQQARTQFGQDLQEIIEAQRDIAGQKGLFTQSRLGELTEDARDRRADLRKSRQSNRQSERNSLRSSGVDPNTGRPIGGGRLDPDANGRPGDQSKPKSGTSRPKVTAGQQSGFGNDVQQVMSYLKQDVDPDRSVGRGESVQSLIKGLPAIKEKDKDGLVQELVGAIPAHDALAVRVAADMYYGGGLRSSTVKLLRRNGYRIRAIPGVDTNRRKKKKPVIGGALGQIIEATQG